MLITFINTFLGCCRGLKDDSRRTINVCEPITQTAVDELIADILQLYKQINVENFIPAEKFVFICHKAIDALVDGEALEFVHDPNGVAIVGDIHGSFPDLIEALATAGWPTDRTLVFLGDYVDRGRDSVAVVLLLLLLKIRYPKRIYLLRGNHETIEVNLEYGLPAMLDEMYGDLGPFMFYTLNSVFDWLPVAAILSDQLYCCHGGISQCVYNRSNLRRLPRPTSWLHQKTDLSDVLLFTDTLWADPAEAEQREPFVPSDRGISYFFNREALVDQLRKLGCRALIRAHCPYDKGLTQSLDGFCYTVHSSKDHSRESYEAAILLLDFDPQTNLLGAQAVYHRAGECDVQLLVEKMLKRFEISRDDEFMSKPLEGGCKQCELWHHGMSKRKILWDRCLSHEHLYEIIREFGEANDVARYYIERVKRSTDISTAAATEFPYFIREMNEEIMTIKNKENELRRLEAESRQIAKYDFEVHLPEDEEDWPKLVVRDYEIT
ncbi:unnamed protein product [Toxocara canis]|uniref:Serine/threonine-protein phosphatase n=1 Tax=Toxocara canis TaxID=6265 RepID=A0A3P7G8C6_TOXCA|nr:unnamed protein product [Toxocara canis]